MKLAISNIAWSPSSRSAVYQLIIQNGFTGLEIAPSLFLGETKTPYDEPEQKALDAAAEAKQFGLKLVSMQALHFGAGPMQLFGDEQSRNALLEYTQKAVDFAASLSIPNLVFGSPKIRCIPDGMSKNQADDIAAAFFRELGDYACKRGTCIALEANAAEYGTNFMTTTDEAIDMVLKVGSAGILLNVDMGTSLLNGEGLDVLEKSIALANHIHISAPYLKPVYQQPVETYLDALKLISRSNYKKFVSIEMTSREGVDDVSHVGKALSFIKEILV